jgi:hypothetical protein
MKIGVLLYTYNRTDDARINMEIIRNVWKQEPELSDVTIVHAYNGEKEWWPEKYLEDELLYLPNPGHFKGAEILLDAGMRCFAEKYPDIEHVIILAPDTWLLKPKYAADILAAMKKDEKLLATCPWGNPEKDNMWNIGMAIDFAIVNAPWAMRHGLFPIRFTEFVEKYSEIFLYRDEIIYLERVFALRFKEAVLKSVKVPSENLIRKIAEQYVYRMREREPVHDVKTFWGIKRGRKMFWPKIGLVTYHEPDLKRILLKKNNLPLGLAGKQLLESLDLNYFNKGVRKTGFNKGSASVNYTD